jgi:hypothetical protein
MSPGALTGEPDEGSLDSLAELSAAASRAAEQRERQAEVVVTATRDGGALVHRIDGIDRDDYVPQVTEVP